MKNIIYLSCLLVTFFAHSQTTGRIIYQLNIDKKSYPVQNELSKQISDDAEKLEFILDFNNKESIFYCNEGIDISDNLAIAVSGGSNPIYYNFANKVFLRNSYQAMYTQNEEFLLKDKLTLEWNITKESKKISGYTCYKATTKIKKNTAKGKIEEEVEVWFCPDFSVNLFPKMYSGLPGIIFEVREKFCVFGITKINFGIDSKITKPSKGEIITEDDYHKIILDRKKEIDSKMKKNR